MSGSLSEDNVEVTELELSTEIKTVKIVETTKRVEVPEFIPVEVKIPEFIPYDVAKPVFVDKEIKVTKVTFNPVMIDKPEFKKVEVEVPEFKKVDITNHIIGIVQAAVENAVKELIEKQTVIIKGESNLKFEVKPDA